MRKVICSTTVSGFVIPFDQNTFQILSIELFASADSISRLHSLSLPCRIFYRISSPCVRLRGSISSQGLPFATKGQGMRMVHR